MRESAGSHYQLYIQYIRNTLMDLLQNCHKCPLSIMNWGDFRGYVKGQGYYDLFPFQQWPNQVWVVTVNTCTSHGGSSTIIHQDLWMNWLEYVSGQMHVICNLNTSIHYPNRCLHEDPVMEMLESCATYIGRETPWTGRQSISCPNNPKVVILQTILP